MQSIDIGWLLVVRDGPLWVFECNLVNWSSVCFINRLWFILKFIVIKMKHIESSYSLVTLLIVSGNSEELFQVSSSCLKEWLITLPTITLLKSSTTHELWASDVFRWQAKTMPKGWLRAHTEHGVCQLCWCFIAALAGIDRVWSMDWSPLFVLDST